MSGRAMQHQRRAVTRSIDQMCIEQLRAAMAGGGTQHKRLGTEAEFEGVKARGQSLTDGLQGRLLQAPVPEKSQQALRAVQTLDGSFLSRAKISPGEIHCRQAPRVIFQINADSTVGGPGAKHTDPGRGKAEPEIRKAAKIGPPLVRFS